MTPREVALKCVTICLGIGSMLKNEYSRYADPKGAKLIHAIHDTGAARCAEAIRAFADTLPDSAAQPQVPEDELRRLREIEHLAWHLLDDSEEDATTGEITIRPLRDDYDALSALLPEDHPTAPTVEEKGNG